MKFKHALLSYSIVVVLLTGLWFARWLFQFQPFNVGFTLVIQVAFFVVALLGPDTLIGDHKLNRRKFFLLSTSMVFIGATLSYSAWAILTPKWAFSITTNKSLYSLGEDVEITVTLKNLGFLTHSFNSFYSDPFGIAIAREMSPYSFSEVWWNQANREETLVSVGAGQALQAVITWNQTKLHTYSAEIDPGRYQAKAVIFGSPDRDRLFEAWTYFNISN